MTVLDNYNIWLSKLCGSEREELLSIAEEPDEIAERFGAELNFGTAGMRGEIRLGTFGMNVYTVKRATAGLAEYITALGAESMKKGVVIAYDTRHLSREFAFSAAETLSAYRIRCYIFEDVRPVPMCSFAVRFFGAAAGIMITASHNPKEYNGYKVYGADGAQMPPEATDRVVEFIRKTDYFNVKTDKIDNIYSYKDKDNYDINAYVRIIGKSLDDAYYAEVKKLSLIEKGRASAVKLVYTPVHGAGYKPVMAVFEMMGINATVVPEQAVQDTEFGTVEVPNPENAGTLKMGVELADKIGADVVLATDPDCDRMGAAIRNDEGKFVLLTGNQIGVLLLDYIVNSLAVSGKLPENAAVVKSFVSTTLADRLAEKAGVAVFNVPTGFKYIGEKIKEWEDTGEYTYIFGFEESYGTLRGTHARDKDAVVGCLLFAEMLGAYENAGKSVYGRLEELFAEFGYYTERNISIVYKGLTGMEDMAKVMKKLRNTTVSELGGEKTVYMSDYLSGVKTYADGKKEEIPLAKSDTLYYGFRDGQFICVRPSGTEPKLKLYVLVFADGERQSEEKAEKMLADIKSRI